MTTGQDLGRDTARPKDVGRPAVAGRPDGVVTAGSGVSLPSLARHPTIIARCGGCACRLREGHRGVDTDALIINAALTGTVHGRGDNRYLPVTEDEIIADAVRCVSAGASILHLHVRHADGTPAYEYELNDSLFRAVRSVCAEVIISGSTTGRFVAEPEKRAAVLAAEPDMASLTLGSMNFPTGVSINAPTTVHALAAEMRERRITPELEIFDLGMADYARYLVDKGHIELPAYANVLLGSLGTACASAANLATIVGALPPRTTWAAAGIGRFQFEVTSLAVAMGGHVRVGLEDNLWMDPLTKTDPASNVKLIERVVIVAQANGRDIATPAQARRIIGLRSRTGKETGRHGAPDHRARSRSRASA